MSHSPYPQAAPVPDADPPCHKYAGSLLAASDDIRRPVVASQLGAPILLRDGIKAASSNQVQEIESERGQGRPFWCP
jgi:hypothetical protein